MDEILIRWKIEKAVDIYYMLDRLPRGAFEVMNSNNDTLFIKKRTTAVAVQVNDKTRYEIQLLEGERILPFFRIPTMVTQEYKDYVKQVLKIIMYFRKEIEEVGLSYDNGGI